MLHLTDISKSFGTQTVLDEASLHVKPGMRIGLVGANGAGKTTLLRLIVGEMSLDGGEISARKDLRIGFLPQEIEEIADHAVIDEVLASHLEILAAEHRMAELGEQLGRAYAVDGRARTPTAAAAARGRTATPRSCSTRWARCRPPSRARTATSSRRGRRPSCAAWASARPISSGPSPSCPGAGGCGWPWPGCCWSSPTCCSWTSPPTTWTWRASSGWRSSCSSWPGALVVISHDRYFLNRMVTHIADLDRGIIDLYAGDYDHYEEEKRQRYEALVNAAKNQQREIDSAESFIRRFRAKNTKAKQVQQKIRQLERTERIDAPTLERKTIKFRFPQPPRTGRVVAEIKHVRKAYGDNVVYKRLDLVVERGEKIALVGPNGAGKSTLLKLLAGVIEPDAGAVKLGHNVRREYFAQHQLEVLHPGPDGAQDHGGGGRPRRAPARGARLPGHLPLQRGRRRPRRWACFPGGKRRGSLWPGC